MDFTLTTYKTLLTTLQKQGFAFHTFQEFMEDLAPFREQKGVGKKKKTIILRHDVDKLPENSLRFAQLQHELGIQASYYFRAVPESWNETIIQKIAELGHEIGYHYECLTTTHGDLQKGIADFEQNLNALRKLAPVKTICMHGSPTSKWDSKDIWKSYKYSDYGIMGEPYFDVNFDEIFYLTDTGRRWDGWKTSLRDKVPQQEQWKKQGLVFHTTKDIIHALNNGIIQQGFTERSRIEMPNQIMFTFHPQRWTDNSFLWTKELILQNTKNIVKFLINKLSTN